MSSDNLGVGALTLGQIALVKRAAKLAGRDVVFSIVGTRGNTPYPDAGLDIVGSAEFALRAFKRGDFEAISQLRRADLVLDIGEGDSFADIYGAKRLSIQVFAKILARFFGKQLVLSPQTIGPFKTGVGKFLGRLGLRSAVRVFARDGLSRQYVCELGFESRVAEVIDVAFALPFSRPAASPSAVRVGINVSGLLCNRGYDGKNQFGLTLDYTQLVLDACRFFLAQPQVEVWLVPHVISDMHLVEDDLRASAELAKQLPGLKVAPRFQSPSEAKSFISGFDFFTGARMHACIAAFSSGVPVLPMAYSRKFNGLFNSLGYRHVIDCLNTSQEEALRQLIDGFAARDALRDQITRANELAQTRLDGYVADIATLLRQA